MCNKVKEFRYRIHTCGSVRAFYAMGDFTRFDALRVYKDACNPDYEIESTMGYAKFNVNTQNYELCNKDDGGVFEVWVVKKHEESRTQQSFVENDKQELCLPTEEMSQEFIEDLVYKTEEALADVFDIPKEVAHHKYQNNRGKTMKIDFKEGDWVIGKENTFCDDKPEQVHKIVNDNLVFANNGGCIRKEYAKLICGFVKDQEVEAAADDGIWVDGEKFYGYDPNITASYLTVDMFGQVSNWWECRIPQPKYKPYSKLDSDILDEEIVEKSTGKAYKIGAIMNVGGKLCIQLYNTWQYDVEQILKEFTWKIDGSPCGELIK